MPYFFIEYTLGIYSVMRQQHTPASQAGADRKLSKTGAAIATPVPQSSIILLYEHPPEDGAFRSYTAEAVLY